MTSTSPSPLRSLLILALALTGLVAANAFADVSIRDVLRRLNESASVKGSKDIKSYPGLFRAYLELSPPPKPIGPDFNQSTIHARMPDWDEVSSWAESNAAMADAILEAEGKTLFGLPYGLEAVEAEFRDAGLVALVGSDGSLRDLDFTYLSAIDGIAAFATAEAYRRAESGQVDSALDLMVANIFVLRQCCDREFLGEQFHGISELSMALANLRDLAYVYQDQISTDTFAKIAKAKLPFLRPDRSRLLIAEGDRVVAEALIQEVFDAGGQPDREKFASTFAGIQSESAPLTRFGAARRWRMIAEIHDSEERSLERLQLVYDDWWRRWRVQEYDPILDVATEFERTNPVRFAAVIYSMRNTEDLFAARKELMTAVYGTAMAMGLCGYKSDFGTYPRNSDMIYTQFVRKSSDRDPFDLQFDVFKYRVLSSSTAVDTLDGRVTLESDEALLYSRGADHDDNRGLEHTDDGATGDMVLWPPMKAVLREQGNLP